MKNKFLLIIAILVSNSILIVGCKADNKPLNNNTNIQNNELIPVKIERLDNDLYLYLNNSTQEAKLQLEKKYNSLLEAFGSTVINRSDIQNDAFYNKLKSYFSNALLLQIYADEHQKFSDITVLQNELEKVNFRISKNFSGKTIPTLDFHVSGFKENVIALDNIISISADKYLGTDYLVYKKFFEEYQLSQMKPEFITRDIIKAWLINELPKSVDKKNLLSEMINQGKILYALEILFPDWKESDLIGYNQEQIDWSFKNEKNIWNKTIQNKYLFSTDYQVINKFIEDSQYTPTVGLDSPGYLGRWVGWQIIRAYVKNTGAALEDIINLTNTQLILKESKYNP